MVHMGSVSGQLHEVAMGQACLRFLSSSPIHGVYIIDYAVEMTLLVGSVSLKDLRMNITRIVRMNIICFGVGKLMRIFLTLTVCIKRKCNIKLFNEVYWQILQKYVDL
jgi:hypothetical protein